MCEAWGDLPVRRYRPKNALQVGKVGWFFVYEYQLGVLTRNFRYPVFDGIGEVPDEMSHSEADQVVDQWLAELQDQEDRFIDLRDEAEAVLNAAGLLSESLIDEGGSTPVPHEAAALIEGLRNECTEAKHTKIFGLDYHGLGSVDLCSLDERAGYAVEIFDCLAELDIKGRSPPEGYLLVKFVGRVAQIGHRLGVLRMLLGLAPLAKNYNRGAGQSKGAQKKNLISKTTAYENAKKYSAEFMRLKKANKNLKPHEIRKKIEASHGVSTKTLIRNLDDKGNIIYPKPDKPTVCPDTQ